MPRIFDAWPIAAAVAPLLLGACFSGGPEPCEHVWQLVCTSGDGACHHVSAGGDDESEAHRSAQGVCKRLDATPTEAEACPNGSVCVQAIDHPGCGPARVTTSYPLLAEMEARDACAAADGQFFPASPAACATGEPACLSAPADP